MEVSSKENVIEEHSRKSHSISCSNSSAGLLTQRAMKERLTVIEEGDHCSKADSSITDTSLPYKAPPVLVRHRRTQSHCPPIIQLACANNIKPKTCHR